MVDSVVPIPDPRKTGFLRWVKSRIFVYEKRYSFFFPTLVDEIKLRGETIIRPVENGQEMYLMNWKDHMLIKRREECGRRWAKLG